MKVIIPLYSQAKKKSFPVNQDFKIFYFIRDFINYEVKELYINPLNRINAYSLLIFIFVGVEQLKNMPSPRLMKTHLPVQLLPSSFWKYNCKVENYKKKKKINSYLGGLYFILII